MPNPLFCLPTFSSSNIGREIPGLMNAIAAGVTLAVAAMALYFEVKSLRQTRDIQRSHAGCLMYLPQPLRSAILCYSQDS